MVPTTAKQYQLQTAQIAHPLSVSQSRAADHHLRVQCRTDRSLQGVCQATRLVMALLPRLLHQERHLLGVQNT